MKIIVGLGNPDQKYAKNRHNVGFIILDRIFNSNDLIWENKFSSLISITTFENHKVVLVKPQTYMNLSGKAIREVSNFYKVNPKDIMIIHDDVYLSPDQIKVKIGGSDAGHNGIKSIDENLGTTEYYRLRYGVGNDFDGDLANYVLSNLSKNDLDNIEKNKNTIEVKIKEFLSK